MKKLLNFREEKMSNNLSIAGISAVIVIFLVVLIVIGIIKRPVILSQLNRRKNSSVTLREAEFTADDRYFLELMKTAAEIIKNTK